jgi:hypothetical protein
MMLFIGTRFSNLYTYLSLLRKSRTSRPIMLFLLNCTPDFLRLVCLCVWCLCVWCLCVWCLCVWCLCVWCLCVWCLCVWCLCVWCHTAPGTAPGDRQEVNSIAFPSTHTHPFFPALMTHTHAHLTILVKGILKGSLVPHTRTPHDTGQGNLEGILGATHTHTSRYWSRES